ncbi:MAG: PIG-L family deacetylase [Kouleothrix sp.]|jgi:LmbE family N-acetylglucosaminyl deacetylase|nr:PIG-L family deacetylase [Kouleothrix sp.]
MTDTTLSETRILGIFAHPDDSEFTCGGAAAIWASQGAQITYCIVTNGAAGSNDPQQDLDQLVRIRADEQRAACAVLGVQQVIFLGYADGTLQPTIELRRELTRLIRQLKPDRVVTGDPNAVFLGDDYINHPDHRAAAEAAIYAVFPSACTRPIFPELLAEGLEPHQVKDVYIFDNDAHANTHIDITSTIERKIEALRCHKSQLDPGDGQWVRDWAAAAGKAAGLAYAESFRVMTLVAADGAAT